MEVEGKAFVVRVNGGGDVSQLSATPVTAVPAAAPTSAGADTSVAAPLAGTIQKVLTSEGQTIAKGEVLLILETVKMEIKIRATQAGIIRGIAVRAGDAAAIGDTLLRLA